MQSGFHLPRIPRCAGIACLIAGLAALLAGCGGVRSTSGPEEAAGQKAVVQADTSAAFAACVAACSANTSLALVTRTGCLEGCEQARRLFPLSGQTFSSPPDCLEALLQLDSTKQARIAEMQRMCDTRWTHVHNRKGCHIAIETFYTNLEPAAVCGSHDGNTAADLPRTKEEKDSATRSPETATPQQPPHVSTGQEPPTVTAQPDAPPPALPSGTAPAGEVSTSTQPAGPLIPPPYTPVNPGATPPSSGQSDTAPLIRDTPKYQKPVAAPKKNTPAQRPSTAPSGTVTPAPGPSAAAHDTPDRPRSPEAAPTPVPRPSPHAVDSLPRSPEAAPTPIPDAQPAAPMPPATAEPLPSASNVPPVPVPPVAAGDGSQHPQPDQSLASTPAPPPQAGTETPAPPPPTAGTVPSPGPRQTGPTPAKTAPHARPAGVQDTPASGPNVTRPAPPEQQVTEPKGPPVPSGPPVPGLNANRPIPPETQTEKPKDGTLLPPVPSMLDRPYNAPTLLAPHIEIPPE